MYGVLFFIILGLVIALTLQLRLLTYESEQLVKFNLGKRYIRFEHHSVYTMFQAFHEHFDRPLWYRVYRQLDQYKQVVYLVWLGEKHKFNPRMPRAVKEAYSTYFLSMTPEKYEAIRQWVGRPKTNVHTWIENTFELH